MPDNKRLKKVKQALDPDKPEKVVKVKGFNNPLKDMLFIFSFFKNLNAKAVISYILTFGTLVFVYIFILISDLAGIKHYIVILGVLVICVIAVIIVIPFVPYGISTGRKDVRRFMIMRYLGNIFTIFMMNIAVSFGICFGLVGIIGGILFGEDQHFASLVIKSILYVIFILIMYTLTSYHGRVDTETKVFNPHTNLQSVIFAHAFMLPFTRFDWYNYSVLGRDLFYNSQTFLGELDFIIKLEEAGFILGHMITFVITCFFAMCFYMIGRNSFFKKHPNELLYDSVEVNSLINKSSNKIDFTDVM